MPIRIPLLALAFEAKFHKRESEALDPGETSFFFFIRRIFQPKRIVCRRMIILQDVTDCERAQLETEVLP